jgi:hypothetical protein
MKAPVSLIKIHPTITKYNQYNYICKNRIVEQYSEHYEIHCCTCGTEMEERKMGYKR